MKNWRSITVIAMLVVLICITLGTKTAMAASPESNFTFDSAIGTIAGYTGPGGAVDIPGTIGGVAVTSIGNSAFNGCSLLAYVQFMGNAPATIGISVFSGTATDFTIYYQPDSTGFSNSWAGYNCVEVPPIATASTIANGASAPKITITGTNFNTDGSASDLTVDVGFAGKIC